MAWIIVFILVIVIGGMLETYDLTRADWVDFGPEVTLMAHRFVKAADNQYTSEDYRYARSTRTNKDCYWYREQPITQEQFYLTLRSNLPEQMLY